MKGNAMNLEEFLSGYHKKVLLVNKVSVGNALIRKYNIQKNLPTVNVQCMNAAQLAEGLVNAYLLKDPKGKEKIEILSPNAAKYILMNLLQTDSYKSFRADYMTYDTVGEILTCINEIRLNGTTEAFLTDSNENSRLDDLNRLCRDYEKYLEDKYLENKKLYDEVKVICFAIEILSDISTEELEFIYPLVKGMQMADLETNRWSCKEKDFVNSLAEKLGIELQSIRWGQEDGQQVTYNIVKAYGISNEVQYIVNELVEIRDEKNNLLKQEDRKWKKHAGNVAVYYPDPVYLNYIRAAFDAAGIPYVIEKGDSAAVLPLTNFYIDVLKSVKNNFSYADLEKVVCNKRTTFENVISKEEKKVFPKAKYYEVLKDGIGWGRDTYEKYCRKEKEKENKHFEKFLKDYIDVFEEGKRAYVMLKDLMEFAQRYTRNQNPDKKQINAQIVDKIKDLKCWNDDKNWEKDLKEGKSSMMKRVDLLLEFFENMKISSEEKKDAVVIKKVNGLFVMERKYNYFIGMSNSTFMFPIRQSAVMTDNEKEEYIPGSMEPWSSVVIAKNKNRDRGDSLKAALGTLTEGEVHFLYSKYDTVNLREDSESIFIKELREESDEKIKEIDAPGYKEWDNYISGDLYINSDKLINIYDEYEIENKQDGGSDEQVEQDGGADEQVEQDGGSDEQVEQDGGSDEQVEQDGGSDGQGSEQTGEIGQIPDKYRRISSTGMRPLLKCPLMFYYQYVKKIWKHEQIEPSGYKWIGADKKGTLCHSVFERYIEAAMPPAREEAGEHIWSEKFEEVFGEEVEKMKSELPRLSEYIMNVEIKECKAQLESYLEKLHVEWEADEKKKWKSISAELGFGKDGVDPVIYKDEVEMKIYDEDKTLEYTLDLNGSIDRVDGYVDLGGCLWFRIIDYKTGKRKNVEDEVKNDIDLQHYVYAMAMAAYVKDEKNQETLRKIFQKELEEQNREDFTAYKIEKVAYVLPFDTGEDVDATIKVRGVMLPDADGDLRDTNIDFPEEVKQALGRFMGLLQNDELDELAHYMEKWVSDEAGDGDLDKYCGDNWCKYKDLCRCHVGYQR